jgi:hypothetical protein
MIRPSPRTNRLAASGSIVTWLIFFNLVWKRNRTGNANAARHGSDRCVGSCADNSLITNEIPLGTGLGDQAERTILP